MSYDTSSAQGNMPRRAAQFWALKKGPAFVAEIRLKVKRYYDACEQQGLIQQYREKYNRYFMQTGKHGQVRGSSTMIDLGTRKNPDVVIHIAELRSLVRQQLAFLMAEPISFQVVSRTGQQRSVMGSEVGEKACNYVYEEHIKPSALDVTENLEVYGATASHLRWDSKKGDDVVETYQVPQMDPSTGQPVPEVSKDDNGQPRIDPSTRQPVPLTDDQGQVVPKLITQQKAGKSGAPYRDALDPTMIAYDPLIGPKANWVVAFERTNLYVLGAKFRDFTNPDGSPYMDDSGQPKDLEEEILKQSQRDEFEMYRLTKWETLYGANDGDTTIMHVYYADSPEIPKGRYVIIIGQLALDMGECPLPAGRLPVRLTLNSKYTDCHLSFADSSALLPIEEALNRLRSSELANYAYYGKQTRGQESGTKVVAGEGISGGQRVLEVPRGASMPGMLPINAMPSGAKELREDLLDALPRISGFGDVSRGNIDDTTSGTHAAVFEAITARNLSLPQAQIIEHETGVMNDVLEMMQRYGNVEFIAEIAGKSGMPLARAFAPEDFSTIRRLVAKPIPDAMRGPLARIKVVELTKDIPDPRERAKAVQMITRGDDEYGKNDSRTLNLIAIENEWLLSGDQDVVAAISDDNYAHATDHQAALDEYRTQPDADPQVILRFTQHIEQHAANEELKNPVLCKLLAQPDPPVLPGNNAFIFAQRLQQAQLMLNPPQPPMPGNQQAQSAQSAPSGANNGAPHV